VHVERRGEVEPQGNSFSRICTFGSVTGMGARLSPCLRVRRERTSSPVTSFEVSRSLILFVLGWRASVSTTRRITFAPDDSNGRVDSFGCRCDSLAACCRSEPGQSTPCHPFLGRVPLRWSSGHRPERRCTAPRGARIRIRLSGLDYRDTTHPTNLHRQRLHALCFTAC
jgi:hypothetical protein